MPCEPPTRNDRMKIVIVGAGLGGLSCALCLRRRGHEVSVLERRNGLAAAGGAITLASSASHILSSSLGLGNELYDMCNEMTMIYRRHLKTAEIEQAAPLTERGEISHWSTLRPGLIELLYRHTLAAGVSIHFGVKAVEVEDDVSIPRVVLESGESISADLVIAADGTQSSLRSKILGPFVSDVHELDPILSDRVNYVASYDSLDFVRPQGKDSPLEHDSDLLAIKGTLQFFTGAEDRYVISLYQAKNDSLSMNFAVKEANVHMDRLWDEQGDASLVESRFRDVCHPDIERALAAAKGFQRWQVAQMPNLPRWRSQNGRIVLLGDAAHAMHPTAGHGFSSTVSDIAVLDVMLNRCGGAGTVALATELWESSCKTRDERVKDFSHFQSRMLEGEPAAVAQKVRQMIREAEMRKTDPHLEGVESSMDAEYASVEFMEWFRTYDAVAEVSLAHPSALRSDEATWLVSAY